MRRLFAAQSSLHYTVFKMFRKSYRIYIIMAPGPSICVIRKFKPGDESAIHQILTESIMEKVANYYQNLVLSQTFPEVAVTCIAVLFIIIGLPFKLCLLGIPVSLVFLYVFVWTGHFMKITTLQNDIYNIKHNYMVDARKCFFVAEAYIQEGQSEELCGPSRVKKLEYDFITEKQFELGGYNINERKPVVIGCIAVTQSLLNGNSAWIRRMGVKGPFRRRHIGAELVRAAVKFCKEQNYKGVELKLSEHYGEAFELFEREGFATVSMMESSYFFIDSCKQIHKYLNLSETEKERESFLNNSQV